VAVLTSINIERLWPGGFKNGFFFFQSGLFFGRFPETNTSTEKTILIINKVLEEQIFVLFCTQHHPDPDSF